MARIIGRCGSVKQVNAVLVRNGLQAVDTPDAAKQCIRATCAYADTHIQDEFSKIRQQYAGLEQGFREKLIAVNAKKEALALKQRTATDRRKAYLKKPWDGGLWSSVRGAVQIVQDVVSALRARGSLKLLSFEAAKLGRSIALLPEREEAAKQTAEQRVRSRAETLARLENSDDMAGAAGEWAVLCALQALPDDYYVLNDVRLVSDRWYYFDGAHLGSAQLDHVVVGPTGVFVIETKRWSQATAQSSNVMSPYAQVRRAGYLLYKTLESVHMKTSVKEVICSAGALPNRPDTFRGYVERPDSLVRLIRTRKGEPLEPAKVQQLVAFLARFTE